jgi:sugar phosphate isomerase/epimerase
MHLSALLTSLPHAFEAAVPEMARLGFNHLDVVALSERPTAHREALADAALLVSCAALGRDLPEGQTLDAEPIAARKAALDQLKRHIVDAGTLGATHGYLIPGLDGTSAGLSRFAEACRLLADFAGQRKIALCLEHIPGRALSSAGGTLSWLDKLAHPNLLLLVDVGHCLITREDPAAVIRQAGPRLGYVHLDDNDGEGDLHWPLLTGRLEEDVVVRMVDALRATGYAGALSLELNPNNADPSAALQHGKRIIDRLLAL